MHSGVRDLLRDVPRAYPLTDNQHDHIQHMLDGDISTANVMANMAGMAHTNVTKLTDLPWIIDSGATNHMVSTLDVLHDVRTVRPDQNRKVHLPNGGVTFVTHTCNCNFTDTGELHDVLYVPEFKYNIFL